MLNPWQQTNTAEMLELAVEYIKDLQKEVKVIMDLNTIHMKADHLYIFPLKMSLIFWCRRSRIQRPSAVVQVNINTIDSYPSPLISSCKASNRKMAKEEK